MKTATASPPATCTRYLMDVLCDYGYVDDAWRLMTRQVYPSWGYMLQRATTIWEQFELKKNPGMHSHTSMYGGGWWLYATSGIRPQAGLATFDVKPHVPTNLLSARCGGHRARRCGRALTNATTARTCR